MLSHVSGAHPLTVQFVDDSGRVLVALEPFEIYCDDPDELLELGLEVPPLPLPAAGRFALRVMIDRVSVAEAPIRVVLQEAA